MDPDFDAIRQEHQQVLEAVERLDAACAAASDSVGALPAAVTYFLTIFETAIQPHMRREETDVYPLLDRYLPSEMGSAEPMLREHETVRTLAQLMRQKRGRLAAGDPAAASEVAVLAKDIALVLREHIRKEDVVINPLLERILQRVHA